MTSLAVFEFEGQAVRSTGDGRFSVFDVLVAFIPPSERKGKKGNAINPRQIYKSITERHSEVVQFCDNFQFPGRGQRETPVASEEGIYQILMLCPGRRGAEFRRWASQIVQERLREEHDPDLAIERGIQTHRKRGKSDQEIAMRIRGIQARNGYTDTLKAHGVSKGYEYANCTNALYEGLFDTNANGLRETRNLPAKANVRDSMNLLELTATMFAETKAQFKLEEENAQGYKDCLNITKRCASSVRKVLDE